MAYIPVSRIVEGLLATSDLGHDRNADMGMIHTRIARTSEEDQKTQRKDSLYRLFSTVLAQNDIAPKELTQASKD